MFAKFLFRIVLTALLVAGSHSLLLAADKPEQAAQAAAEKWLALVDAGKFTESYQAAAPSFQNMSSEQNWKTLITESRGPLGALLSRKYKSLAVPDPTSGAPAGQVFFVKFDSAFANRLTAVETVTTIVNKEGVWMVAGYSLGNN